MRCLPNPNPHQCHLSRHTPLSTPPPPPPPRRRRRRRHHHQVLGDLELIDQGELDHKIIAIDASDPMASKINSIADLKVIPITDPSLDLLLTT